ncbi:hypothetical protein BDY21DRAFT_372921 [Lineolata rhizophorae]|uniref:TMEM205-like domain-containing protein n=1 Tax=Lineolata rhizophorae TaxID=578093 RepID=A0A6A6NVG3_9PEZI|nr:hypothetical protein BDY21DRAFT_372921 [Lineolata rhizophorae]
MPFLTTLTTPAPYHLLSYGTLLGTTFFQSFIGGTTAFRVLPRHAFSTLQSNIFPIYFGMQTVLPVAMALTYPDAAGRGIAGLFEADTRWSALVPTLTMLVTGAANWVVVGPATTGVMKERKHQETRDGKKSYDPGPHSPEMQKLNKKFMRLHGVSSLLNLSGLLAMIWYGIALSERLRI